VWPQTAFPAASWGSGGRSLHCSEMPAESRRRMGGGSVRQYVVLFIDPGTGEIEAHGPVDEPARVELAGDFRAALAADSELGEVGVLILPHAARRAPQHCRSAALGRQVTGHTGGDTNPHFPGVAGFPGVPDVQNPVSASGGIGALPGCDGDVRVGSQRDEHRATARARSRPVRYVHGWYAEDRGRGGASGICPPVRQALVRS
jgi:hypothetical protein